MLKLQFKNHQGDEVSLDRSRITIGRDPSNDMVIDHAGISGFHAEIQTEQGRSSVVDLGSSNGTFLNAKRLNGKQVIKAWDVIKFDAVELEVVDTEGRRPTIVNTAITDEMIASKNAVDTNKTTVRAALGDWILLGKSGSTKGKSFPIAGKVIVGRDSSYDISLDSSEISRQHAELAVCANKLQVRDLGSANGVFVNGKKVQASELRSGDEIRFDEIAFKVQGLGDDPNKTTVRPAVSADLDKTKVRSVVDSGPNATRLMPTSRPQLTGISEGQKGNEYKVSGMKATIGREQDNDFIIDDETISSHHARIYSEAGIWKLEDKGSSNGTFVNGTRISSSIVLNSGDKIRFGKVELNYSDSMDTSMDNSAGKTRLMPSVGDNAETKTSLHAVQKKVPAWVFGLGGFAVVGIALGFFLFGGKIGLTSANQPVGPLQVGKTWNQHLPDDQTSPSTPALADINHDGFLDVVLVDGSGHLIVLDGQEGKRIIDVDIMGRIIAPPVTGDITGNGVDDIIVATNTGEIYAINGKGKILWQSQEKLNPGAIVNRPVLSDVNGDGVKDVIVPTEKQGLVALDGSRGWELWNSAGLTRGKVITSPVVKDINGDGILDYVSLSDQGQLVAITAKEGKVWKLWDANVNASVLYASPAYVKAGDQGLIIVATNAGGIIAIHADSGRMAWQSGIKKEFFASPVVADANGDGVADIVVVAMNGDMHVLNSLTGDEIWSAALGVPVRATPALFDFNGDGLFDILILDTRGNLHIYDMARGRSLLEAGIPGADGFVASPVLGDVNNDGMLNIITASQNGAISALSANRLVQKGAASWPFFLGNDSHGF